MDNKLIGKIVELYTETTIDPKQLYRALLIFKNLTNFDYNVELLTEDNHQVLINDTLINDAIFNQEIVDFKFVDRQEEIDSIINLISETQKNCPSKEKDIELMKEDLFMLAQWNDDIILSSISTNKYLSPILDAEEFNSFCEKVLTLNKTII